MFGCAKVDRKQLISDVKALKPWGGTSLSSAVNRCVCRGFACAYIKVPLSFCSLCCRLGCFPPSCVCSCLGATTACSATHMFDDAPEGINTTNRILFLTDLNSTIDSVRDEQQLVENINRNAARSIYMTVVGIGMDLNMALVKSISCTIYLSSTYSEELGVSGREANVGGHDLPALVTSPLALDAAAIRGARYCSVDAPREFQTLMDEEFAHDVTILAFDIRIRVQSPDHQVVWCGALGVCQCVDSICPSSDVDVDFFERDVVTLWRWHTIDRMLCFHPSSSPPCPVAIHHAPNNRWSRRWARQKWKTRLRATLCPSAPSFRAPSLLPANPMVRPRRVLTLGVCPFSDPPTSAVFTSHQHLQDLCVHDVAVRLSCRWDVFVASWPSRSRPWACERDNACGLHRLPRRGRVRVARPEWRAPVQGRLRGSSAQSWIRHTGHS